MSSLRVVKNGGRSKVLFSLIVGWKKVNAPPPKRLELNGGVGTYVVTLYSLSRRRQLAAFFFCLALTQQWSA